MDSIITKKLNKIHARLGALLTRNERIMLPAIRQWFNVMLRQIRHDLTDKYIEKDIASEFTDWDKIRKDGIAIIKPAAMSVYASGGDVANKVFNVPGGFDVLTVDAVKQVDKICAELVREVSQGTKEGIRVFIKQGIKEGKGMDKIARELRPIVGLTERQTQSIINYEKLLEQKHPEMSAKMRNHKTRQYASRTQTRRLNTIARTETARAQNAGYVQSMKEMGVEQLEFSAVTNACKICIGKDGNKYDVDKAASIIPVHPSCRCAMLPVVGGKTYTKPQATKPSGLEPEPKPRPGVKPKPKPPEEVAVPSRLKDKKEIAELKEGNKKLRGELKGLRENNQKLGRSIENTKERVRNLDKNLKKANKEIRKKDEEIMSLKKELKGTKKQIKELEREIKEFPGH